MDAKAHAIAYQWVIEREAIRIRKANGVAFPWTDDPILKAYRFCNVRRENDRVTKWIDEHIRKPFANNINLWWMLCAARVINWPDTLNELINCVTMVGAWPTDSGFSPELMGAALEARASRGDKVWTGAYMITAPPIKGAKKTYFVGEITLGNLWKERERFQTHFANPDRTLRSTHQLISQFNGWGPFMAYQAVVDMRFTALLSDARDIRRWCAAGPGTIRGLNRLAGRPLGYPLPQGSALVELVDLWPKLMGRTGVPMDLSDVPNVMCEVDKYIRVMNGEGKPRALYVPGRGS